MTDFYAVVGNPIGHSKSPAIHTAFAEQTGQDLKYEALLFELDLFAEQARAFFEAGGRGLNVTVPFKLDAWQFAEILSKRAKRAGSVNTLMIGKDKKIYGDNTDGVGLVRDILQNHGGVIEGKRVLVLGAGGAVRGVLEMILAEKPQTLVIANRTVSKAQALVDEFTGLGSVTAVGFEELSSQFDLVINGTAASLQGDLPPLPTGILADGAWCYDMMYGADETPFNAWAREQGAARMMDGLGMLVEQAAESFFIWRHVRPGTEAVISSLRAQLKRT
ncbi:MAG: shikimate dehydrogenase [Pseudomonadales bacterium]